MKEGNDVESYETGKYRKPVPPPFFKDVPVLDDDGNVIWEEKEVAAVDGRVFRNTFYIAFVSRMRGRLWEIKKSALKEAGALEDSSSTAVALRDKKEEVNTVYREQVAHLPSNSKGYGGALGDDNRGYDHTGKGRESGRKAAETVPVNEGRGVKS